MKWHYYAYKEIGEVWKQNEPLKGNPSTKYHLWILDKKEAKALAKKKSIKIIINLKSRKMAKKNKKSKKARKGKKSTQGGQRRFSGSIALTKLKHVIIKKKGKKGKKIECIVIPIDKNYIERGVDKKGKLTGALYLNVSVITKTEEDERGQHGFIGQNVASKTWKEAKGKEQEKMGNLPILGSIKDFAFNSNDYSNDTSGSQGAPQGEEEDLPF